jgi:hypothetical protein
MHRAKTKQPRAGDKEKAELSSSGKSMDSASKKRVIKVKRLYECKTCGLQFDTRQQALTHVCRHTRIRA